jgi:hypothetical protein
MTHRIVRRRLVIAIIVIWFTRLSIPQATSDEPIISSRAEVVEQSLRFNRDIRPLLSDRCFTCHGPDIQKRQADLRLDLEPDAKMISEGIIIPFKPQESELLRRINSQDGDEKMPPSDSGKELNADEKKVLEEWIRQGAIYEPHWSFSKLLRPSVPAVERAHGEMTAANAIDAFIEYEAKRHGLSLAALADPYLLLRRLSFDLTGLPPSEDDMKWLEQQLLPVSDSSTARDPFQISWEPWIDRKLSSPLFGEKLATWWLDLVRYADTVGYHGDQEHHAAAYRDWVIAALNDDLPFDQFSRLQLAGDLVPDSGEYGEIASAYNRLLQTSHEGGVQAKEYLAKYAADRVRNFSQVWLGLTIGCAECHDHKFDPVTQKEFYQLAAFFADVDEMQTFKGGDTNPTKRFPEKDVLSPIDQKTRMRVMISKSVEPRVTRVFPRGNWLDDSGEVVEPMVPSTLHEIAVQDRRLTRLDLANWIFQGDNPITARVVVNRLWSLYFGRGISPSLEDYGSQGEAPSHPELLDWLAIELMESGWDLKHVIRLIVQSNAYRRSTLLEASEQTLDGENRWFTKQVPRRLAAEFIRDGVLLSAGLLDYRMGGTAIRPYQPAGYFAHLNFPTRDYIASQGADQYRRGVYVHWQRQYLHPMLRSFDAPSREECTARRGESNTPNQMLVMMNDTSMIEAARSLAWNVWKDIEVQGEDSEHLIAQRMWQRVLTRPMSEIERQVLIDLYRNQLTIFRNQPAQREEFLSIGQWRVPNQAELCEEQLSELAAWSFTARSLWMLSESLTQY